MRSILPFILMLFGGILYAQSYNWYLGNQPVSKAYIGSVKVFDQIGFVYDSIAYTSATSSDTVNIWLMGTNSGSVVWSLGDTTTQAITSTPTLFAKRYSAAAAPFIKVDTSTVTGIIIEAPDNWKVKTTYLNKFASLETFISIGPYLEGSISDITLPRLQTFNPGDQKQNTNLRGDLGSFINATGVATVYIDGGDLSYTDQSFTAIATGSIFTLSNNLLLNTDIDQFLIDLNEANEGTGTVRIIGTLNGYRTATSDEAVTALEAITWNVETNDIPVTDFTLSSTTQFFEVGSAITTISVAVTDTASNLVPDANIDYEYFVESANGLTMNTNGDISGSPTSAGINWFVIRVTGKNGYTGQEQKIFSIIVNEATPALTIPMVAALTDSSAIVDFSTTRNEGTIKYVLSTSTIQPSIAQIDAGLDHTGSLAVANGLQTVNVFGMQAQETIPDGLTANTTYYVHAYQDASSNSSIVTSTAFTTLSGAIDIIVNFHDPSGLTVSSYVGNTFNNHSPFNSTTNNLVTVENIASSVDISTSNFLSDNNFQGLSGDQDGYPAVAWRSNHLENSGADATVTFSNVPNGNYTVITGTNTGSSTSNIDAGGIPVTVDNTAKVTTTIDSSVSPSSGNITVTIATAGTCRLCFIRLTKN